MTITQLLSLLGKLGGIAVGVLGVNTHSLGEMTVGAGFAAVLHAIDSVFNSPKGESPTP
jgi:hypothetical protein